MSKRKISLRSGSQIAAIQLAIAYTPEHAATATGRSLSRIFQAIANRELSARMDGEALILEDNELRRWIRTFPAVGRARLGGRSRSAEETGRTGLVLLPVCAGPFEPDAGVTVTQPVFALAFQFCRELAREFTADAKAGEMKDIRKISFAGGVEKFAKSDRSIAVTSEIWDRDPFLLGTPDGTVDLRTGELREPDPRDGITKITSVAPAPSTDCPRWLQFLDETFGDADLIRFIQQWNGYCLTGDISEHALVFGFGNGGNGKGVWLNTVAGIMADYATTAAMETFAASKNDRHPTELAMLRGARMVTASETEEGRSWAESRIKQMTGGDPVTARFMQKDFFTFQPAFKLTIIGNHKPLLRNVDEAARRRFNLIPFNRVPAHVDRHLPEKLREEWPGILRWMIDGCLAWHECGLERPQSVIRATESYFEDQDMLSQWLTEDCDAEPGNIFKSEATAALFASWTEFATRNGERTGSSKAFSAEMVKRGFERGTEGHAKVRCFKGVRLLRPRNGEDD